ncbi:hybrid sensor histidine kinase/response regulator transcription factor [Sphingobacterium sp. SGR-19]|uniref:hybrid sensor histidine kinase/response regulator transcription factor n=1 Tax=Sphingobacterium sp. SGR-19 TaxID=2710886 RepID=UPI0013ED8DDC|nr:hybrid sensor histidine kinase/response regulator transcription factor [Sphingobacterium sp. SGR-19]NGM64560.1 helix-turn-helix domain-containing protein [Sphingobacterium sp. SGR-19]
MSKQNRRAVGLIVLMLLANMFHGLTQPREPRFKTYSTESGLSHNGVACIIEDAEGFIWFGTWDGLNRYDGNDFVVYKSQPGDRSTLKNNKIRDIVEGKHGYLWVRTFDKKVYRFDKRKEEFLPIITTDSGESLGHMFIAEIIPTANGDVWLITEENGVICVSEINHGQLRIVKGTEIPNLKDNVNFVFEDHQGRVWFGTTDGLRCLIKKNDTYVPHLTSAISSSASTLNFIKAAVDKEGRLFFAASDGTVVQYEPTSKTFSQKKISRGGILDMLVSETGKLYLTAENQGLTIYDYRNASYQQFTNSHATYLSMYEDRSGNIWLEPERDGVVLYEPTSNIFRPFVHKKDHNLPFMPRGTFENDGSFKVFEDVNNVVWVCMKWGGFGYYDKRKNDLSYFYNNPDDKNRLFSNNLVAAYSDKKGVLWFCTRNGGVHKATFFSDNFKHRRLVDTAPGRFDNEIRALLRDSDGKVWLTNKHGDIYFHKNGDLKRLENDQIPGSIYCITEDRNKNVWIGTKGYGLVKLTPENTQRTKYKVTRYENDPNDSASLSSNQIYSITEDHKGRLWIGTFQKGLNLLVEDNGEIRFKNVYNSFKNYPKRTFNVIRHSIQGPDNRIWLGTTDGLLRFDPDENPDDMTFIPTVKIAGDKHSLGNNDIMYLFRSKSQEVWIGTFGGGLNKVLNKPEQFETDLKFKAFTKDQGLPNDIILSITEESNGNLWMTTENGIAMLDVRTKEFRNYSTYNGLPRTDFSEAACLQLPNGEIFFGCMDGYISFYPDKIVNEKFPGNMVFTGVQIYNKDVDITDPRSPLKTSVNYADEIVLNHDQDVITIEYTVLDYRFPDDISYAYILEGYDKEWHNVKNQKQATYTKIPPGRYTFRVKTANSGHFENVPEKSIAIVVKKPWWLSAWAILCYIILAISALEVIRRIVFTMIRLKHKIAVEKKIAALKIQFFTNISHELRTPLTLIVNPLLKLKETETLSEKGVKYLHVANRNTDRMVRFVNQLLDFRKIQEQKVQLNVKKVELVSFLTQLLDNFADIVEDKQISLELITNESEIQVWCDEDKTDIVFFNVISNAVKFSPHKSRIVIRIEKESEHILVQVHDQGNGVHKDQLDVIFEPYYEGGNSQDKAFKGTGIGLALSKDIMKLQGGTIAAEINDDGGMTFTIKFLEGNAHFEPRDLSEENPKIRKDNQRPDMQTGMRETDADEKYKEDLLKLLLVEDNPDLKRFMVDEFKAVYTVYEASNGREGYEKAREWKPDVIISDVMMPETDGIQMLEMIKNDVETSHIPIILLTAKSAIEDQIKGLSYGADFYITKPFHIDYVKYLLRNLLKNRQQVVAAIVDKQTILKLEPTEVVITSKDEAFLREVIQIIENEMADTSFNIEVAVNAMAMGRTTFYKKLKSLTNMSPVEFIRDIRLKRAKQLLDTGELTVTEVAYKVGFNSSGYFSTCFKEMYQVSPSEYLKNKG